MRANLNTLAGPEQGSGYLPRALAALAQDMTARASGLWQGYWAYQARRATVLMLASLDDRLLKDIGLTRSEIWPAVHGRDLAPSTGLAKPSAVSAKA